MIIKNVSSSTSHYITRVRYNCWKGFTSRFIVIVLDISQESESARNSESVEFGLNATDSHH